MSALEPGRRAGHKTQTGRSQQRESTQLRSLGPEIRQRQVAGPSEEPACHQDGEVTWEVAAEGPGGEKQAHRLRGAGSSTGDFKE